MILIDDSFLENPINVLRYITDSIIYDNNMIIEETEKLYREIDLYPVLKQYEDYVNELVKEIKNRSYEAQKSAQILSEELKKMADLYEEFM